MFSESKITGAGYVTLNVIRGINIISLLLVVVASWIMLVMTVKTSNFYFFDGVSHFITSTIGLFLIISEVNLFRTWFMRNWPLLGPDSGFVLLGTSMVILGFNILGNLNKGATSVQSLGLPMWRVVIASGIMTSIMGFANIAATYVFCRSELGITGRQVRSHGAKLPKEKTLSLSSGSFRGLPSYERSNTPIHERKKSLFGFKLPIRGSGIHISKPVVQDPEQFGKWNERASPVAPELQRPPTALHPAYTHPDVDALQPPRFPPASSRYSEVSNMDRF